MGISTYQIQNLLRAYSSQLIKREAQNRVKNNEPADIENPADVVKISSDGKKKKIFAQTLNNILGKIVKK